MSDPVHNSIALDHPEPEHQHKPTTQTGSSGAQAGKEAGNELKQGTDEIKGAGEKLRKNLNAFADELVPTREKQERERKAATMHPEGTNLEPAGKGK